MTDRDKILENFPAFSETIQTEKDESKGKGKNKTSGRTKNTRTREKITLSTVNSCDVCGENLLDSPCTHIERRTKIDIIFEKVVEHVDAEIKQCPACDSTVKGSFPSTMQDPLQYGVGLKAFVVNLSICWSVRW